VGFEFPFPLHGFGLGGKCFRVEQRPGLVFSGPSFAEGMVVNLDSTLEAGGKPHVYLAVGFRVKDVGINIALNITQKKTSKTFIFKVF